MKNKQRKLHNTSQKYIMYKLYNMQNMQNMANKNAEYAYFADLRYYALQNIQKEYCDLHLLNSESRHVLFLFYAQIPTASGIRTTASCCNHFAIPGNI